ncbi:MAG: hypothetical protein Q9208_008577 [Pyrenodesmia sp. 3 TL-2023]
MNDFNDKEQNQTAADHIDPTDKENHTAADRADFDHCNKDEESDEDVVDGIEEDPDELPDDYKEFIDRCGNLIWVKAHGPSEVKKQRIDAAIAAVTDKNRVKRAEDMWKDRIKIIFSTRTLRTWTTPRC